NFALACHAFCRERRDILALRQAGISSPRLADHPLSGSRTSRTRGAALHVGCHSTAPAADYLYCVARDEVASFDFGTGDFIERSSTVPTSSVRHSNSSADRQPPS